MTSAVEQMSQKDVQIRASRPSPFCPSVSQSAEEGRIAAAEPLHPPRSSSVHERQVRLDKAIRTRGEFVTLKVEHDRTEHLIAVREQSRTVRKKFDLLNRQIFLLHRKLHCCI